MKSFNNYKKSILLILFIYCCTILYLTVTPIIISYKEVFLPRKIYSIQTATNYYTIIFNLLLISSAIVGLVLGYFHFENRKEFDNTLIRSECKRNYLNYLLGLINKYDENVDKIMFTQLEHQQDLNLTRTEIGRCFDNISIMLEENQTLLGFSDEDLISVIQIHSFVDKNDDLMREDIDKFQTVDFNIIRDEFKPLIQDARRSCYKNIHV